MLTVGFLNCGPEKATPGDLSKVKKIWPICFLQLGLRNACYLTLMELRFHSNRKHKFCTLRCRQASEQDNQPIFRGKHLEDS